MTASPVITTVSAYGDGGASTRVRVLDWLRHLGLQGERHTYRNASSNRPGELLRDLGGTARAEVSVRSLRPGPGPLILSREASPFSRGGLEARLLSRAGWGVYDFDDAIFLPASGARGLLAGPNHCARACTAADVVIVGNSTLAEFASAHARDVRVIPSCVEPGDYPLKTSWELRSRPVIGWLGSPSTEAYVASLAAALGEVHRRTGAVVRLVSGPGDNPALAPMASFLERVPWTPGGYAAELAGFNVAIAPLTDTPWARGKCAYKLLQYAAAGLPMVGTPVGANERALSVFDGLAVTTDDEWVDGLVGLIESSAADREKRGRTARAGVEEYYSFAAWADAWSGATRVQP